MRSSVYALTPHFFGDNNNGSGIHLSKRELPVSSKVRADNKQMFIP
jgi:hypothetical protein